MWRAGESGREKVMRESGYWTPERRLAQSERMKGLLRDGKVLLKRKRTGRPNKRVLDEREILFLGHYYGEDSETKGNMERSAQAAGGPFPASEKWAERILAKYDDCSFKASAKAVGITKPYLAWRLRQILDLPIAKHSKEIIAALRLMLANLGESTDHSVGTGGNVFTGPVMVIQGATPERLKALKGAIPQLTREQLEQASNERSAARLELLKRGELPPLVKSDKGYIYRRSLDEEDKPATSPVQPLQKDDL